MRSVSPSLLIVTVIPLQVLAADVPSVDSAVNLGRTLVALVVVVALVFALAWGARRFSVLRALGGSGNDPIKVVAQRALGTRERLMLVEVDGRRLLLGVVPGAITRLHSGPATTVQQSDSSRSDLTESDLPESDFAAELSAAQRSID